MSPVRHRTLGHVILRAEECEAFQLYIEDLNDSDLGQEHINFTFLAANSIPEPWEQFVWKRDQIWLEMERRREDRKAK
jgi:hypothetical protein